jgi:putrescine aminotransferase
MFASEAEGVVPDVLVLAKALSGGLVPISAYVTRRDHWRRAYGTFARCELHCTTFRGGPLACAAALATLDVLTADGLVARAAELGAHLERRLRSATAGHPLVREVRGRGLLWGIELATAPGGVAAAITAQWLVVGLLERGVVTQAGTLAPSVVRVEPPLTITRTQIDRFGDALADTLAHHATGKLAALVGAGRRLVEGRLARAAAALGARPTRSPARPS